MTPSILYRDDAEETLAPLPDRQFAVDLNLDQVFAALGDGREQLDLLSLFFSPLHDIDSVVYRHEVIADLERPRPLCAVRSFGQEIYRARAVLTSMRSLHNRWQQRSLLSSSKPNIVTNDFELGPDEAARSFSASVCPRVFTHFKRNEDPAMTGGKLDEELARMSHAVSHLSPGCLLLCNEPFGSTNEKEGSDIGRQVFIPLAAAGVRVLIVTHLFDLAESLSEKNLRTAMFLRAPRQQGAQPFKLVQGPPEATAYGEDVYTRVFGTPPAQALDSPGRSPGLVQRST